MCGKALAVIDPAPRGDEGDARVRWASDSREVRPHPARRALHRARRLGARPEARWRKTPADVVARAIAGRAGGCGVALAPRGILAYITCSPHVDETRAIVAAALARHPELEALDTPAVLAGVATRDLDLPPGTHAQLWPHRHGTDAMFIQLLQRR
ncbi:MAG: hypothetical protein R2717_07270 [Schumannella sp.]